MLAVVDLRTDEVIELIDPRTPNAIPGAMAFAGSDSLFVSCSPPETIQFWDLTNRQCKWTALCETGLYPGTAVAGGSKVLAGHHNSCKQWDTETGQVVWSHDAARTATAVAFNPRTGDYIAGYSRHNYTFRSGLGGAVRIWNASGDRLTTFAAHRGNNWPNIIWTAVSTNGEYLVTADPKTVKVWDYSVVSRRTK